mmetsp:Transcript_24909/g.58020  ORF Transcript_24909/g.58020 Transcript_24909/m.58020 type:complete len:137 (-) Transcript_24909:36-446(-)
MAETLWNGKKEKENMQAGWNEVLFLVKKVLDTHPRDAVGLVSFACRLFCARGNQKNKFIASSELLLFFVFSSSSIATRKKNSSRLHPACFVCACFPKGTQESAEIKNRWGIEVHWERVSLFHKQSMDLQQQQQQIF